MQLGKYDSDRDSALHFLCLSEWSNESFGNVESPTGYVWRISNSWEDVKPENMEFSAVVEDWQDVSISTVRESLVGHFLLQEDSNGLVHVREYITEEELLKDFQALETEHYKWDAQEEGE